MIPLRPGPLPTSPCPRCAAALTPGRIVWQGIHVAVEGRCPACAADVVSDLPVGHAVSYSYQVDLARRQLHGPDAARAWLGQPLLDSLLAPCGDEVAVEVERPAPRDDVVVLVCLDFLYGHALLKLLNAQRHLDRHDELGLVVVVPRCLRWLVPDGVAEVWTVDLPLGRAQRYHPSLDRRLADLCRRFRSVHLSRALAHPRAVDVSRFTRVARHDPASQPLRVTFVWRDDRPWVASPLLARAAHRLPPLARALVTLQNRRVRRFFTALRRSLPGVVCAVAGLGRSTRFPAWVEDHRVERFTAEVERGLCELYAASRLVVGVHGSNLLLPSAHAGATLDLMPRDRWGNIAQDVLVQEDDVRMGSFRYRFTPISTPLADLVEMARTQCAGERATHTNFVANGG